MNPSGSPDRYPLGSDIAQVTPVQNGSVRDVQSTGPLNNLGSLDANESTVQIIAGEEQQAQSRIRIEEAKRARKRLIRFGFICVVLFALLIFAYIRHGGDGNNQVNSADASGRFPVTSIPLASISQNSSALTVQNSQTLSINGQLNVNNSLVIAPTTKPDGAVTGQLYYDEASNQLSYFNGSSFQTLVSGTPTKTTIDGVSGSLTTGSGLSVTGAALNNIGVLTLQGQSGNITLTAGPGIVVNGTTLSSSGVLSLGGQGGAISLGNGLSLSGSTLNATSAVNSISGGGAVVVTGDGNGNYTISTNGSAGTGTITSAGGTSGRLAMFDGVQDIASSIISQSGSTITISGSLHVTGTTTLDSPLTVASGGTGANTSAAARINLGAAASGLNNDITQLTGLTTAISATEGGTGLSTLTASELLFANSTTSISQLANGTSGQCLVSNGIGVAASFQTCTGAGGVSSLDALTGALTISNTTGAGNTITIASAKADGLTKGIATFNSTNFKDNGGGLINTVQDIASTATPTFNGVTLSNALTVANGGTGLSSLTADELIFASTSSTLGQISVGTAGQCLTSNGAGLAPSWQTCPGAGSGVTTSGGTANTLAKFTSGTAIGNSIITDNGATVTIGGILAVNTLTPTAALTVGATSQNLTLQGATVGLAANAAGITNTLTFAAPSGLNKTITIPNANGTVAVSASGPLSLDSAGNLTCPTCLTGSGGSGGSGVSSVNGATGSLTLQGSDAASFTTVGTTITVSDASGTVKGLAKFNSADLTVTSGSVDTIQGISTSSSPQFAGLTLGSALTVGNGGTGATTLTTNGVVIGHGTSALTAVTGTNGQCLEVVAGTPAFTNCPGAGGGGVSTVNGLSGALTINNVTTDGISTITINNAKADSGITKGIASFNSTNFSDNGSGVINTIQNINSTATPTFGGLTLNTALGVSSGGTGLTTLTANQLLFANSTTSISQLANGTTGQCLVSNGTTSAPSFQTCTGAGGVSSINTLTGAVTIDYATGAAGHVTIQNAKADSGVTKGVASFNSTNFSDNGSGVINTIQGIATTSTPQFAGLTLTSPLGISSGGTGLSTLTADGILYASSTSALSQLAIGSSGQCLISNGVGLAPSFQTCTGAGGVSSLNSQTGAVTLDNASGSGGHVTINNAAADGITKGIATFNSTNFSDNASGVINTIQGIATTASPTFANLTVSTALTAGTVNGDTLSGTALTFTGNATVTGTGGLSLDTSGANMLNVGRTNATTVNIGNTTTATATTIQGGSTGGVSIQAGAGNVSIQTSSAGTITVGNAANGGLFVNNGATQNTVKALGNQATNTTLTASSTVDAYTYFTIAQTTASITVTLPTTGVTAAGITIYVSNTGSTSVTIAAASNVTVANATSAEFIWNGTAWNLVGMNGSSNVTGSGTSGTLAIWSGTGTISNSDILDNTSTHAITFTSGTTITDEGTISFNDTGTTTTTIGNSSSTTTTIDGATVNIGASNAAHTINIANGTGAQAIVIGNTNSASTFSVTTGATSETLGNSGNTIKTNTNSTTAFQIQNASVSSNVLLNADTTNMRISIGNVGTATGQLFVSGSVASSVLATATGTGGNGTDMKIVGNYAYTITNAAGQLHIFDISNPASPVAVGFVNTAPGNTNEYLAVAGKYAYVSEQAGTSNVIEVINVSNPATPISITTVGTANKPNGVYVAGKYLYAVNAGTGTGSNTLQVFDLSNPASPVSLGTTAVTAGSGPQDVYVQGRYAYVTSFATAGFQVFDISNPSAPSSVGTLTTGLSAPYDLYVQGAFAYITNKNASASPGETLQVINVASPSAPTLIGTSAQLGSNPTGVFVQGRYAYVATGSANTFVTVDVSNTSSPVIQGTALSLGSVAPSAIYVNGRYAYVLDGSASQFQVVDLGGEYAQQLQSGGTETGTLTVDNNANVYGDSNIQGSLNVGANSQFNGDLGVNSTTTTANALSVTANNLTTGNGVSIVSTSAVQTAGSLLNVSNNVTLDSSASNNYSGQIVNVSRNLIANKTGTAGGTPTLDNSASYWQQYNYAPDWNESFTVNGGHDDYYLLVNIVDDNLSNDAPTAVYYGSTKMTLLGSSGVGSSGTAQMWLYGLAAPAFGTNTITVANNSQSFYQMTVSDWYNVSQTSPYGSYAGAKGNTGMPTRTASVAAGRIIVDNMFAELATAPCNDAVSGTGQTLVIHNCADVQNNTTSYDLGSSYAVATGGSQTLSWSGTTNNWWSDSWVDLIGDSATTGVLGDNTISGTPDSSNNHSGNYECSIFKSSYSGTVSTMSAQFAAIDTTYNSAQVAIYRANLIPAGASPTLGAFLGSSSTATLVSGTNNFTLSTTVTVVAGTYYWLCAVSNVPLNSNYYAKDELLTNTTNSPALETGVVPVGNNTFGTWPSKLGSVMDYGYGYQIYATVVPLGNVGTTVSGAVASFSSNCTAQSGSCMDGSNILQLSQQFSGATGPVLNIQNAGSGDMVDMASGGVTVVQFANDGSLTFGGSLTGSSDVEYAVGTATGWDYPNYTVNVKALSYNLIYAPKSTTAAGTYSDAFNIVGLPNVDGTIAFIAMEAQKPTSTNAFSVAATLAINGSSVLATTNASPSTTSAENYHENVTVMRTDGQWYVVGSYGYNNASSSDPVTAADYAEWIDYSGNTAPQPGEILSVGDNSTSVKDSSSAYDSHIIGVVSTNPYQVGGKDDGHSVIMALTGRVPVKVSTENGPIEPGDPLTSSSTPGVAMKATSAGQIIGTALEAYNGTESSNEINVQLHPSYNNPRPGQIQGDANISGNLTVADIDANNVTVTGQISAATLTIGGNANFGGNITINGHIVTAGGLPTVTVGAAAGTSALVDVTGTDTSGKLLVTLGAGASAGDLVDLTFNAAYSSAPNVAITAGNSGAAQIQQYVTPTSTGFSLDAATSTNLTPGQTYTFYYHVLQ